jgi:hypothetical protein
MRPHPIRRGAALVAGVAGAALVVAGCAAGTVSGHGIAAVMSSTPALPSLTPSILPSSPTTSSSPAVVVPSGAGTIAGRGGVLVTNAAGHFRVRMPSLPQRTDQPGSFGGYKFTVHIAIATTPYVAIVEGEDVDPPLGAATFESVLRSVVNGFRSTSSMRLVRQSPTTFRGSAARIAIFAAGGMRFELMAFVYSGSRLYVLVAPPGRRFEALVSSFEALP